MTANTEIAWMSREAFLDTCREKPGMLPASLRWLLLSDGTVTHFLESLFLEAVAFELEEQSEIIIRESDAERLFLPKGEKGIKRSGWLTIDGARGGQGGSTSGKDDADTHDGLSYRKRKVYAVSILPVARLPPSLHQEIILRQKPLGRIIHDQKLNVRRDDIEVGLFLDSDIARGFGLSPTTPLWARRYCLTLSEAREGFGIIFEAFCSEMARWE